MTVYFKVEKLEAATNIRLRRIIDDMLHAMLYPFHYPNVDKERPFERTIGIVDRDGKMVCSNLVALRFAWTILDRRLEAQEKL